MAYNGDMEAAVTLRQRHADRTRAAIVSAALELFRERGFQGTTIDEIAERADVYIRVKATVASLREKVAPFLSGQLAEIAAARVTEHRERRCECGQP